MGFLESFTQSSMGILRLPRLEFLCREATNSLIFRRKADFYYRMSRIPLNASLLCDSVAFMNTAAPRTDKQKDRQNGRMSHIGALTCLLGLGALAVVGPFGILAWGEDMALLEQREAHIAALVEEQADYENLVMLLDPRNVDPDLSTELVRKNLNVVHPDEFIIELESQ